KKVILTLCWLDPPAEPNVSRALVNDLDVKLISPDSSQVWLPWTLNIFPDPDSLLLPAKRGRDTINPQEQISITNPQEGNYSIEIRGQSVHTAGQKFALVYDWELKDEFLWTNPFEKGNMTSNRTNIIRWKTSFENVEGRIEYRLLNQGSGWNLLADKISVESEYHSWRVPDVFTPAQLRMIINNDTLNSDTFVISRPLEMSLQLDCEDSILVSWERKEEISSYRLWTFADNQLTELIQTSDSFAVLPAFSSQERWMGVQPILNHGYEGLRGPLLNLDFLNGGCYLKSFFAREADNGIETTLKLGAWYGVEEIRIEKQKEGRFESLVAFPFPSQTQFDYLDLNPNQGANTYRAVVKLNNGTTLYSDEQTVIYVAPTTSLLYPNPSYDGDDVFIQTKNLEGSQFYLYDNMGRLVVILSIDVETEILFTDFLTRGIYHYHIIQEGERKAVGKLLIH
ncbi:MAG: T9SS type A sorting domain-containing protein, partial [Bacteroidetes bacterium]|nr:T9SS type A sorting domain-containing protein [Bacteroidota bacterium]